MLKKSQRQKYKLNKKSFNQFLFGVFLSFLYLIFFLPLNGFSYAWEMTDLFRTKMKEDFLVGNIWYHTGEEYEFEGRDNAITHIFGDYQNDPGSGSLFQGGIIAPILSNRLLPSTFTQGRIFLLHHKEGSLDKASEIMVGGKITIGNWEYYEKQGAAAVTGSAYFEFAFGYIATAYASPFTFGGPLNNDGFLEATSKETDRFYYEINIPFLYLSSFYKALKSEKKGIWGISFNYAGSRDTLEYLELAFEHYPDNNYNFKIHTKGIKGWFNLGAEFSTQDIFYYGVAGIEHLFLIRGDAKGEQAYFSKKYAWGVGFYFFGGYYDPTKDPAIDYNFFAKADFPFTFGAGLSVQMPFMIFLDVTLIAGSAFLIVATAVSEIPIALAFILLTNESYKFYLTQAVVAAVAALGSDISNQWDRDVWQDNTVWCKINIGMHYNDREALTRNPVYALRDSKAKDIFYYGKIDIFF